MKAPKFYIGFYHYAGYHRLIIEATEAQVMTAMRAEYLRWKKEYTTEHRSWKEALDYYGWYIEEATTSSVIDY